MQTIETLRWARDLIRERTNGKQYLIAGWDGMPTVYVDRSCLVALHFSLLRNLHTGCFDCRVKGYIRTCGGYHKGEDMEELLKACGTIAGLVWELEKADIHVEESVVQKFCEELKQEGET